MRLSERDEAEMQEGLGIGREGCLFQRFSHKSLVSRTFDLLAQTHPRPIYRTSASDLGRKEKKKKTKQSGLRFITYR